MARVPLRGRRNHAGDRLDELTKYFTDTHHKPVKDIANGNANGPRDSHPARPRGRVRGNRLAGNRDRPDHPGRGLIYWGQDVVYVLYGVAMTGIGMLTLTGNNVAMDSFGPISDNANGIGEMAGLDQKARQIMADLDAVGNTTKAITKGVAIGSAVIAAVSLFGSFLTDVSAVQKTLGFAKETWLTVTGIRISVPNVFIGMLIGGTIPWLFSSLTVNSVARAAGLIVEEVRRQFKIPGLLEGKVKPDYGQTVSLCTKAAQRELIPLALIAVLSPIAVGLLLHVEALGGFLAGVILSGQLLAVFMASSGGAWDNAKKTIEDGLYGGKGSEAHKASVIGDTVGDPLKDTSGPALNPMIKVINLVSLLAAPLLISLTMSVGVAIAGAVCVVIILGSFWFSKRGGFPGGGKERGELLKPETA